MGMQKRHNICYAQDVYLFPSLTRPPPALSPTVFTLYARLSGYLPIYYTQWPAR